MKSNKTDSRGQLTSRFQMVGDTTPGARDSSQLPSLRPIVLPKGQQRRFDYRVLVPTPFADETSEIRLSNRYTSTGQGMYFEAPSPAISLMAPEEYFFVVLTTRPQRYTRLRKANWAESSRNVDGFAEAGRNYRIAIPPVGGVMPMSETMLDWTSTAVVWWDDLSPDALTPSQQLALADWVNFGGTLIVNGPDAAESINQSGFASLLALRPTSNIELDPDAGKTLLESWSVSTDRSTDKQIAMLNGAAARVAVDGRKADDAVEIEGSGNLILIRRQGLGKVVQARFDLMEDWLSTWRSYDSFINGVVLGRPRRKFRESADPLLTGNATKLYPDLGSRAVGADLNTRLRITARDAILPIASGVVSPDATDPTSNRSNATSNRSNATAGRSGFDRLAFGSPQAGIGGWNDQSDVLDLCADVVASESAIEVPEMSLVMKALGLYLLVLVPMNYIVFRLMGRLEYAWLAVPVIAIGGTIAVSQAVRLDIGFARSQTEVALLEMQPGYERGHLTRVVTIYNSLSSEYEIQFESVDAAAAPIGAISGRRAVGNETFRNSFQTGPSLSGFAVESNSTNDSSFHAEQIIEAGGGITLDGDGIVNTTKFDIEDTYVVDISANGEVRIAIVGGCESGQRTPINFQSLPSASVPDDLPLQTAKLIRRLISSQSMHNESTRLVGRIDGSLSGMEVTPAAEQTTAQTVVLAHLKHQPLGKPLVDENLPADTKEVRTDL